MSIRGRLNLICLFRGSFAEDRRTLIAFSGIAYRTGNPRRSAICVDSETDTFEYVGVFIHGFEHKVDELNLEQLITNGRCSALGE
jgi:hypothetical protein